jgi:hypothetical protein
MLGVNLACDYWQTEAANGDAKTTVAADVLSSHQCSSAETSRAKVLVRASWTMNCRLESAVSWSGRVPEGLDVSAVAEPSLDTAHPANDPCLIRHGFSVP